MNRVAWVARSVWNEMSSLPSLFLATRNWACSVGGGSIPPLAAWKSMVSGVSFGHCFLMCSLIMGMSGMGMGSTLRLLPVLVGHSS